MLNHQRLIYRTKIAAQAWETWMGKLFKLRRLSESDRRTTQALALGGRNVV